MFYYLTIILFFITPMISSEIPVSISTGVHFQNLPNLTVYEASLPITFNFNNEFTSTYVQ